jgi:hypothetical protein
MLNCHIVLPSTVAVFLSVGVDTKKSGDFAEGDGVKSLIVAFKGAFGNAGLDAELLNGKGMVCMAEDDKEERIWTTVVGIKEGWGWVLGLELGGLDSASWVGTEPAGKTENIYGLTNATYILSIISKEKDGWRYIPNSSGSVGHSMFAGRDNFPSAPIKVPSSIA